MVLELKALESNFNDDYLQNTGKHNLFIYHSICHLKKGGWNDVNPILSVFMAVKLLFVNYIKSFKIRCFN